MSSTSQLIDLATTQNISAFEGCDLRRHLVKPSGRMQRLLYSQDGRPPARDPEDSTVDPQIRALGASARSDSHFATAILAVMFTWYRCDIPCTSAQPLATADPLCPGDNLGVGSGWLTTREEFDFVGCELRYEGYPNDEMLAANPTLLAVEVEFKGTPHLPPSRCVPCRQNTCRLMSGEQ